MKSAPAAVLPFLGIQVGGCRDIQSVLSPQSEVSEQYAVLSWILFAGGTVILVGVIVVAGLSIWGDNSLRARLRSERMVFGGGLVLPIFVLSVLLIYSMFLMRAGATTSPSGDTASQTADPIEIEVVGEQWWWRIRYRLRDGHVVETANELRIPVGRRIRLTLTTADVIHSFWVPRLAGKLDMIPGRRNAMTIVASAPGVARGQCAEYCGGAHARMSLHVVSLASGDYDTWLTRQRQPAAPPATDLASRGQALFLAKGCGGCHRIGGTLAAGSIGPDLTHFGSRMTLAAATLPNDVPSIGRWIRDNQRIKPGNRMLAYESLDDRELFAIATYLERLK